MKYIFVTGGVVSGLGKGITAASLGRLLKARGLKVAAQKLDPYINVDPGTMSPYQHGEVFVTEDGAETDLDLGHYERFIDEDLNQFSNLTTGKVYANVIAKERRGEYLGKTVQTIPHITDEIKRFIYSVGEKTGADVVITEIGGTTGDMESQPFLEAIRQVGREAGRGNALYIHVTLVPYLRASGEHKSKPTQHSVKELQGFGISPDIIVLRCDEPITDRSVFEKIAGFCGVRPDCVIENVTLPSLYEAPLMLEAANFSSVVCRELGLKTPPPDLREWREMVERIRSQSRSVTVGLVGKYVQLHDAYLSVAEALRHAGYALDTRVEIRWIDSEGLTEETVSSQLAGLNGILVPGGFGSRGIEGMVLAAQYAREKQIPYLGICLGMQIAVMEFARHAAGLSQANSGEFDPDCPQKVIDFMPGQNDEIDKGGTLRLGSYPCRVQSDSRLYQCYEQPLIYERHRHRYEFNNQYRAQLEMAGLRLSGQSPDGRLVEAVEITGHPFFVGVQFHPEFKSRPNRPHPLFRGFVAAAGKQQGTAE
ncbi:CTP synthase [Pseudoflavonifractor phocaeensis]|uniref:CTP synthase n=1 Tax=Pseudoflavonifractor phocaeensis TaxID=1870988 RepID=UPI0025A4BF9A|nr:CTP synthase [Pseudoflavonifractor phocaeensis]MDM8237690.1 CTP synthase [Pseudoflavonifractor phocaeensis]